MGINDSLSDPDHRRHRPVSPALIILLGSFLYLPSIFTRDFWLFNEGRRALIAEEMVRSGDWVVPRLMGAPIVTKPPLFYWLEALAFIVTGGPTDWAARLPSFFASLACLLGFYYLIRHLINLGAAGIATLALATAPVFYAMAGSAEPEMLFVASGVWAIAFLARAITHESVSSREKIGFFICLSVAWMAKGPIVPVIALITIPMAGWMAGRSDWTKRFFHWWPGWILMFIPTIIWALAAAARVDLIHGILYELSSHVQEDAPHKEPFYFYIEDFPKLFFPWAFFLLAAMVIGITRIIQTRGDSGFGMNYIGRRISFWLREGKGERALIFAWFMVSLIVLSAIPSKRYYYGLILAAPAAALLGLAFRDLLLCPGGSNARESSNPPRKSLALALIAGGALLGILAFARRSPKFWEHLDGEHTLDSKIILLILALWLIGIGGRALLRSQHLLSRQGIRFAFVWAVIPMLIVISLYNFVLRPSMNPYYSLKLASDRARALIPPAAPLAFYGAAHTVCFYLQRPDSPEFNHKPELEQWLEKNPQGYVILYQKNWDEIESSDKLRLVDRNDKIPTSRCRVMIVAAALKP